MQDQLQAQRIVCFGDSITAAPEFPQAQRWPTILQRLLDARWPGAFEVLNRGISNHTSAQGFDRLATDVLPHLPAILLVEFGFNDANVHDWARVPRVGLDEFRKNLREFQRLAVTAGGQCVFVINHSIGDVPGSQGNNSRYRDNLAPYNMVIRDLAATLNTPYIDLPAAMAASKVALGDFLAEDQLHLSRHGNQLYAEMILEGLQTTVLSRHRVRASSGG